MRGLKTRWLVVGFGLLGMSASADARAEGERKRHAAEEAFLPANAKPLPPPVPGVKGTQLNAVYDEGFRLRTNDNATDLRLAWSAQLDARTPLGKSEVPSAFDVRRARLDFIATIWRKLFIRIGLAAEDTPYIRNAFADYEIDELFHVRVGQTKVPFSTEWSTLDNQVNFMERAYSQPIHPFLDRGVLAWGKLPGGVLVYNVGVFAGAGIDADAPRGDVDDGKEVAVRLFAQPFARSRERAVRGLAFVTQGTWEEASVATKRFELKGMTSPIVESNVWRWVGPEKATLDSKARIGGELHWLYGPLTLSTEIATLRWTRLDTASGGVHAATAWASIFVTGEEKLLDNFGWRQPNPKRPVFGGDPTKNGPGAIELLARASTTSVDESLSRVFEGARRMNEVTLGASWTLAYAARLQLNFVHTWVPDFDAKKNGIVSGASSEVGTKTLLPSETMIGLRAIFRI